MDEDFVQEEEEYLALLQSILDAQQQQHEEADFEDDITACLGIMIHGLEEARRLRSRRHQECQLYLIRHNLLPNPRIDTPWQVLFDGQNDQAFITTMGLDIAAFTNILEGGFEDLWNASPIPRRDVPSDSVPPLNRHSLNACGVLGLVLHFLNSTMLDISLCEIFAIIPSTVSRYIHFSVKILLATLRKMEGAQIKWPSDDDFQENNNLIVACHPLLEGAFGSMDGLNLPVQTSKDQEIKNATFNGCTRTPDRFYLVTDTPFPRGNDQIAGKIRALIKDGTRLPADPVEQNALMKFDHQLLSYRQTVEWGMRTMQGSFGHLRVPLLINYSDLRGDLLETTARLFNFRTRSIGHNQIRTVYKDVWSAEEQVWIDFEKILFSEQRQNDRVGRYHMIEVVEE